MYTLFVKDKKFTIPKQNLRLLAMIKTSDLKLHPELNTDEQAIEFLKTLGIEVCDEWIFFKTRP